MELNEVLGAELKALLEVAEAAAPELARSQSWAARLGRWLAGRVL
jgi:hypothetical protein